MAERPIDDIKTLNDIKFEIKISEKRLINMPKKVLKEILGLIVLAIIFPFLPGKRGRKPMVENWEYDYALIFVAILFFIIYLITYYWRKEKLEKRIRELKLKQHLL